MQTLKRCAAFCLISFLVLLACKKSPENAIYLKKRPVVNAGQDQILILPTNSTQLIGSGSDPDGTLISYQWSSMANPEPLNVGTAIRLITELKGLERGVYRFTLKVTDNDWHSAEDEVEVLVLDSLNDPCNGCWDY